MSRSPAVPAPCAPAKPHSSKGGHSPRALAKRCREPGLFLASPASLIKLGAFGRDILGGSPR